MEIIIGNQDLANEILLHLSPKSLTKAKCISKHFLSLISDPYLERRYSLLNPPSLSGLFLIPTTINHVLEIEYVPLNPINPIIPSMRFLTRQGFKILQSCNGLLLCSSRDGTKQGITYHVCNPTTRQFVNLPNCPYIKEEFGLALAFNPMISPHYKVICVKNFNGHQVLSQISSYTSKNGLWISHGEPFLAPKAKGIDFNHGVYCNGNIHWMKGTHLSRGVYFDCFHTNCLKPMPKLPINNNHNEYFCEYFGNSQDHLYVVVTSLDIHHLEIFEMKQDYSSWLFKFKINLSILASKFPSMARKLHIGILDMSYECDVLTVIRGQNKNQVKVLLSIPGEVIAYNHKKKTSWKVCDLKVRANERDVWYKVYSAYEYFETICSL